MSTILLLEDDESLIDGLEYALIKNGFSVEVAKTVKEAKKRLEGKEPDLFLLDVMLPDGSGFEVCEEIRKKGSTVPVIFLTAADEEVQIIRGLDTGGDDYITKPFKLGELCSRIRALLRRSEQWRTGKNETEIRCGALVIDLSGSRVYLAEEQLELTGAEYRLLCLLAGNPGQILTREKILDRLWDEKGSFVDDNTLSVYIRRLRRKTEKNPSEPEHLKTVRGLGYMWEE